LDNVTHTLAGLVIADAALQLWARAAAGGTSARDGERGLRPGFRGAAIATTILASNGPDLDFVYTRITGGKLGYLLHHRGHTHTLLAALPLGVFSVAVVLLGLRLRGLRLPRADKTFLLGLALLGGLLHVLMDFGNNYGVHPFWPLNDSWYYGDAIFIIDPWLMLILAGVAFGQGTSLRRRGALLACLGVLLVLVWASHLTGPVLAALLTAATLIWLVWQWRATPRWRWASGAMALLTFWAALLTTRHLARANVRAVLEQGSLPLVSLVSTPAPGNPLCWSVISVQYSEQSYVIRHALASGLPGISPVTSCEWHGDGSTAPLVPSDLSPAQLEADGLSWGPEFHAPLAQLLEAQQNDCRAAAFLRFARVPFWVQREGHMRLIGDYRFDRSSALEFAELVLDSSAPCPRFVPPWEPPLPILDGPAAASRAAQTD
jgi:inner membrane protein